MKKRNLYRILFLLCFWECCFLFMLFYEGAITDYKPITHDAIPFSYKILIPVVLISLIGASFTAAFEVLFFSKIFRKKPFGKTLLYKTSFYLFNMVFWFSIINLITTSLDLEKSIYDKSVIENYVGFIFGHRFLFAVIYWGFVTFLGLFILQVSDKFGQGVLINFLMGKYHQPRVENRIFMFMDLRDSTSIAEKLGHIKYSQLIQDCFFDLTDIVLAHGATIYQYVGDEVVLSWNIDKGINHQNCLKTFFSYDNVLQSKSVYYKNKYGVVPEFKAGLNLGAVTVAEVGEIKKELAYHGDVLNTAARIQGRCNDYKRKLLVSEQLKTHFDKQTNYGFEFLGDVLLKGKEKAVNIYAVNAA